MLFTADGALAVSVAPDSEDPALRSPLDARRGDVPGSEPRAAAASSPHWAALSASGRFDAEVEGLRRRLGTRGGCGGSAAPAGARGGGGGCGGARAHSAAAASPAAVPLRAGTHPPPPLSATSLRRASSLPPHPPASCLSRRLSSATASSLGPSASAICAGTQHFFRSRRSAATTPQPPPSPPPPPPGEGSSARGGGGGGRRRALPSPQPLALVKAPACLHAMLLSLSGGGPAPPTAASPPPLPPVSEECSSGSAESPPSAANTSGARSAGCAADDGGALTWAAAEGSRCSPSPPSPHDEAIESLASTSLASTDTETLLEGGVAAYAARRARGGRRPRPPPLCLGALVGGARAAAPTHADACSADAPSVCADADAADASAGSDETVDAILEKFGVRLHALKAHAASFRAGAGGAPPPPRAAPRDEPAAAFSSAAARVEPAAVAPAAAPPHPPHTPRDGPWEAALPDDFPNLNPSLEGLQEAALPDGEMSLSSEGGDEDEEAPRPPLRVVPTPVAPQRAPSPARRAAPPHSPPAEPPPPRPRAAFLSFDSSPPPPVGEPRVAFAGSADVGGGGSGDARAPAASPVRSMENWKAAISAALRGPSDRRAHELLPLPLSAMLRAQPAPRAPSAATPSAVAAAATAAGFRLSFDLLDPCAPPPLPRAAPRGDACADADAFSFTNFHAAQFGGAQQQQPSPPSQQLGSGGSFPLSARAGEGPSLFAYVPAGFPSPPAAPLPPPSSPRPPSASLRWVGVGRSSPLAAAPTASPFALAPSPALTGGAWLGSGKLESPAHLQGGRAPLSPQPLNLLGRFALAEDA